MRLARRWLATWPVILAVAVALRVTYAWQYAHRFRAEALGVLPFLFEPGNIARALVTGHGFASPLHVPSGPTAWVAPVYPLVLAAAFRVFGLYTTGAYAAAAGFNIACSAVVVWPLYALGRRLGGGALAAAAAWIWAVFPNAILLPAESLWPACLAALLVTFALWLALELAQGGEGHERWIGFGLLWAAILMTAPALLSILPCLLIWIVLRRRRVGLTWRSDVALAIAVVVVGCAPWTVRNRRRLHAWIPLRSDLGLALWIGNNPRATVWPNGALHPINNEAERTVFLAEGEVAFMGGRRRAALAYIASHPARTLYLAAARAVALWAGGAVRPWRDWRDHGSFEFRFVLLFNVALALAALAGLIVMVRRRAVVFWPLAAYVLLFPCAYYFTAALPRYLLPVQPAEVLLVALGGAALFARRAARPRRRAALLS